MGSLGWATCWWCWHWEKNMYISDGIDHPLCDDCSERILTGLGPPWKPDAVDRRASQIKLSLGVVLSSPVFAELIAQFEVEWQVP